MSDHTPDFQSVIVQALREHHPEKKISMPSEYVAMISADALLSQDDTDNACAVVFAYLGISNASTEEASALKWLMRNYFLNPDFRTALADRVDAHWAPSKSQYSYLPKWKMMHRVRGVVAAHLESIGDTLPISFTEPLFSSGRVPKTEMPKIEAILNGEFDLDVRKMVLEGHAIESIVDMANRIELLWSLPMNMDAPDFDGPDFDQSDFDGPDLEESGYDDVILIEAGSETR